MAEGPLDIKVFHLFYSNTDFSVLVKEACIGTVIVIET